MTYVLMILFCTGHGANANCDYRPYHEYKSMADCVIAMDAAQSDKSVDVAPELACIIRDK